MGRSDDALIYAKLGNLANIGKVGYLVHEEAAPGIRGLYPDASALAPFGDRVFHPVTTIGALVAFPTAVALTTSRPVAAAVTTPTVVVAPKAAPTAALLASATNVAQSFTSGPSWEGGRLQTGQTLSEGEWVGSQSRRYRLGVLNRDCILQDNDTGKILWSVGNAIPGVRGNVEKLVFNDKGNLLLLNASGSILWSSMTGDPNYAWAPKGYLEPRDSGIVVLNDTFGKPVWDNVAGLGTKAPMSRFGPNFDTTASVMAASKAALEAEHPAFFGEPLSSNGTLRRDVPIFAGQWIGSSKIRFGLYKGNMIVLDAQAGKVVWSTKTAAPAAVADHIAKFVVSPNGVFVAYDSDGAMLWSTPGARGSWPNGWLEVHDDANVVLFDAMGKAFWDLKKGFDTTEPKSFQAPPPASYGANVTAASDAALRMQTANALASYAKGNKGTKLTAGQQLRANEYILSPNGKFRLQLWDGALQVRQVTGSTLAGPVVWRGWGSGAVSTPGEGGNNNRVDRAVMQDDSNFVCYAADGAVIAASDTGGEKGCWIEIRDDGDCVLLDYGGSSKWSSTSGTATAGGVVAIIKDAANVVIHNPITDAITAPYRLAVDVAAKVASGDLKGAWAAAKADLAQAANNPVVKIGASFVGTVPGLGTLAGAALQAGLALARGESLTDIGLAALKGALPGGPLAQLAFDGGVAALQGRNVGDALMSNVRSKLSPEAQAGLDLGLSLVKSSGPTDSTSPVDIVNELKVRAEADLMAKDVRPTTAEAQAGFDVAMAYSRGRVVSAMAVVAQVPQPALQAVTTPIATAVSSGDSVPVPAPVATVVPTVSAIAKAPISTKAWTFGAVAAAAVAAAAVLL